MNRVCAGLLLLLLLASVPARSQENDSDDDAVNTGSSQLFLRLDKQGAATVRLFLGEKPKDGRSIRQGLANALHCSEDRFHNPNPGNRKSPEVDQLPAAAREGYLRALADANSRQLTANCGSTLYWTGGGRGGDVDFAPLLDALRNSGFRNLWVYIYFPPASHIESSPQGLNPLVHSRNVQLVAYQFSLNERSLPPIHLFYGLSRRQLLGSFAVAIGFVLFPVLVTLWVRRTAQELGKHDPTAAWFSYSRTINWCVKGSMLLWITSGLGARQSIQEWLSFAFAPGWATTLLDIAVMIGPAFAIYFVCLSLSYPLHLHLRGTSWTRREFLLQQLVNAGLQAFPLLFLVAAIESIAKNANAAASFFLLALLSWIVLRSVQMRVSNSYPHALTTGDLRDRVFALANKARVKITQIFVLPTGKGQIANAYATGNGVVMFTDYLLQHLSKREVEAVAAHEIAHLELGHVKKRALALSAALMLPGLLGIYLGQLFDGRPRIVPIPGGVAAQLYSGIAWFWHWSQRDFFLVLTALMLFYLLSRRFEFAADERAVWLNGDAEAQITGLLKLSRLNLMPIQWGKATGSWLTHPSMVRRAERIAASARMTPEKLNAILERHKIEMKSRTDGAVLPLAEDHFSVPEATDPENLRSAATKHKGHQLRLWTLLVMHVMPPAMVAAFVQFWRLEDASLLCYLGGAIATPILCILVAVQLALAGRRAQRARLFQRFQREGLGLSEQSIAVGFSPGALVRFYGTSYYNWDTGFLLFSGDRISYIGEQVRFSLGRQEIDSVCLGQGGPSWWKFPRVYIRWKRADGTPSMFSIASLEPSSLWKISKEAERLLQRVRDFRTSSKNDAAAGIPELPSLALGDITSRSPRELGGVKTNIQLLMCLLPLAVVVNAALHADAIWYVLGISLWTRLVESIPVWGFHDRLLVFESDSLAKGAAAK